MALWTWRSALCAALRSAKEIGVYADLQTLQVHTMVSRSLLLCISLWSGDCALGNAHNEDRNCCCFSSYRLWLLLGVVLQAVLFRKLHFWHCNWLSVFIALSIYVVVIVFSSIKDVTFVYVIRFFRQIVFSIKFPHKLEVFFHLSCRAYFQLKLHYLNLSILSLIQVNIVS